MTPTLDLAEFTLPPSLEASAPPEAEARSRDDVKLLVSDRESGSHMHAHFPEIASFLAPSDLLVVNDSATLPAALDAWRADGGSLRVHLSTQIAGTLWIVEPRSDVEEGENLWLPGDASLTVLAPVVAGRRRLWYARLDAGEPIVEYLYAHGEAIRYRYVRETFPMAWYQTIFARIPGSAEMPSAGRPFTDATLASLARRGVEIAPITLHTGVSSQERSEPPYEERFLVPERTAKRIGETKRAGGRIVAVGTTVVRALETAAHDGSVIAASGWTDVIVTPERGLRVVDAILTGLHEPQASHLAMLRAFLPPDDLMAAYVNARSAGYRWHEFGDVHLIA